jgi:epoxide hydrolase-like predicted phosphatase
MAIKGIVFDVGGVLETTPEPWVTTKWEEKYNLKTGELDQKLMTVWRGGTLGTMSEEEVHKNIGELMGWSVDEVNRFMDDVWAEYLGTLNVELDTYFRNLRPRFKTAILSNSFAGARRKEQEVYKFEDACDFIIYSHEVGMKKPDRAIYEMTCAKLGLLPSEVIFLDDREGAVNPACEFGIHGILFKGTAQAIADIEARIKANAE